MGITDIQRQKRNRNRCSIYIDGKYAFSLDYDTLLKSDLHLGDEVPDELKALLIEKDGFARARDYAYTLLSYRDRTEREIVKRLRDKGFEGPVVEKVRVFFRDKGLVDDRAFARKWIDESRSSRPMGRIRVEHELRRRMVGDGIIEEVCARELTLEAEEELARKAARKKWDGLRSCPRETAMRRLGEFLRVRGFDFELIRRLMREYLEEEGKNGPERDGENDFVE